jgi:3-phosphoshikimate 1-carboxyvinyltransferase
MQMRIKKTKSLKGRLKAPPSKSYTHRAIIIGSLDGHTRIINPLFCDDTVATIKVMRKLGAYINRASGDVDCLNICGFDKNPKIRSKVLDVGESGTLLRIVLALVALAKGRHTVSGKGTLCQRPNKPIVDALRFWGVDISGKGREHKLPVKINSSGSLKGGGLTVSGRMSSQTISSLLIAASLAQEETTINIKDHLVSRPYVDITIDVLKWMGVKVVNKAYKRFQVYPRPLLKTRGDYIVRGDYSSAAFLMAAACLIPSEVTITDLVNDKQGDKAIINILRKMGAIIEHKNDAVRIKGPFDLRGVMVDCADTPDLVPILAVLGCFARGTTRIYNIEHLIYKESNRIAMPALELSKLGAKISFTRKEILIKNSALQSAIVEPHNDHRLAMALAVAGLRVGLVLQDHSCVAKSYPNFFSDIRKLGAHL